MRTPKKSTKSTSHHHHPSSNWKNIRSKLPKIPANVKAKQALKRQLRVNNNFLTNVSPSHNESQDPISVMLCQILQQGVSGSKLTEIGRFLAIDCEMVGVGPNGSESVLARVSIVNYYGAVLLDCYVSPKEKVTDYRTWVSGITPEHLANASSFSEVTSKVAQLIKDKVLIGHAITNDLQALLLKHPRNLIRDTSKYGPLRVLSGTKFPSLKKLAALLLRLEIQTSSHSSVDDARATMAVYRTQKDEWETSLRPQHSSIAPLFRLSSRPKTVIATPTQPKPTSSPPVAPMASSSKSTPVVNDAKKISSSKEKHDQMSPKMINKVETKGKNIEPVGKEVSLTNNPVNGNRIETSEVIKDKIGQPNQFPPKVIKSATPEFKKPRTANLRLSATLQHIRNEQETAVKSASQAPSSPSKIPGSPSSRSGQISGSAKKTKSSVITSTSDLSKTTSTSNQVNGEVQKPSRSQVGHPYARKPPSGNQKPISKTDVPRQRLAGGVKGVREYGTEMIGVVRKSNNSSKPAKLQASSSFQSRPQSTNCSGWWDS